jgi:hypothetical protein
MSFTNPQIKEIDQIIISYLELSDYVTLLKTHKNFKELFIVTDIIHKDKIFDFLKYLVESKDIIYTINIINALQSNNDCIAKYNYEDFADNHYIFSELIIMGGTENEEFLYDFVDYYIVDYLHEMMKSLYDIICNEYPLNHFINKLLYIAKSHLAKRAIEILISCFNDDKDLYSYYTFMFQNDKYFNFLVIERYIKLIPNINWVKLSKHIEDCLLHNINHRCDNDSETKLNYIKEFLKAAVNLKSNELLDIVEKITLYMYFRDSHSSSKINRLVEKTRKMINF